MTRAQAAGRRILDIIGVGDSDVDVMIKVDHIPGHDEKVRGTLLGKFPGGIIGNFCTAAAKFGAATGIATVVGDDEYGRLCREDYRARGLDMRGVVVRRDAATYFCIVHLDSSGEKALTLIETPLLVPRQTDIDLEYVRGCRYLHLTSLDFELLRFVTFKVADAVSVSFDIEAHTDQSSLARWEEVIHRARTIFINEAGLKALMGSEDLAGGARRIRAMGPDTVVVTRGALGSMVLTAEQQFVQPAFTVPVKDTTGAGDCFNAVFLSCLAAGQGVQQACLYGTAAAALAIQSVGSRTSFPSRAEVESFLSSHAPGEPETGRTNGRA